MSEDLKKNKVLKLIAGVDGGNNSIKLVLEDGTEINYENIYCERDELALDSEYRMNGTKKANKFTLDGMLDVKVLSKNEQSSFIFGKQSQKYRTKTERVNNFKSDDKQLVKNSIVAIANTIVKKLDPSKWTDEINAEISICTGLPFHEYGNNERKEKYLNLFKGTHTIEFLNPSYPVRKMTLAIKNVEVEIEGLAALKQTIMTDGILSKEIEDLVERVISMIDFGCYTTDIVGGAFYEDYDNDGHTFPNFEIKSSLCKGITNGVGTAIDGTIEKMKKKYESILSQNDNFSRQDIIRAASKDGIIAGTNFSIFPFFEDECIKLGNNIGKQFAELYKSSGDKNKLDKIYISGGGTFNNFIIDTFKSTLIENGFNKELFKEIDEPVYANGQGYLNIALATFGE